MWLPGNRRHWTPFLLALVSLALTAADLQLPLLPKSVRFAVIGDDGTGEPPQYQTAAQMAKWHERFPFDTLLMLGDNLYGHQRPDDFRRKFETPYKALLDAGVKFYASIGNHDSSEQLSYEPFHMQGHRYYNFGAAGVDFFALDSNEMDSKQLAWLDKQLAGSKALWKICFMHHPLYSDGKFHGPDTALRAVLEPLLDKYDVKLVLSGHEHVYERIKPRNGVWYFVLGNSGQLRRNNLRPSAEMAKGFDTDCAFLLMEIAGDQCFFQAVSRKGETVDSGVIERKGIRAAANRAISPDGISLTAGLPHATAGNNHACLRVLPALAMLQCGAERADWR